MKKLVVLSGAGISAESGIATFRDSNGLWENHEVTDVATPEGWERNPALVLEFYNQRRKQALSAQPNAGHKAIKKLEEKYDVTVITQNVDNLHEKAGSSKVLHLHGELFKSRSTVDENLIYDVEGWELRLGDKCAKGSQLRPHIVWFGEMVPMMEVAIGLVAEADIVIVTGTSLQVYPAASLLHYRTPGIPIYLVDPKTPELELRDVSIIKEKAGTGLPKLVDQLLTT
ncbi:NAD-dependent deacylase [Cytophagaceae bacterium ABcell3]|nr:NAD-dependent deacylase [Cytophagaceae bacterium ABcell3]